MSNKINLKILLYMLFFSLSLFIISLIAYIDIEKNFLNYKIEQFNISIDIEVDRIKESLDNGSTLKTFIGYKRLYERIIDSDKSIVHAQIYDAQNNLIFTKRDTTVYKHNKFNEITSVKNITIKENSIYYSINHKIIYNNNFIGNITILVDKEVLFINLNFVFYLLTVIFVIIFFTIFYYFFKNKENNNELFRSLLKAIVIGQVTYVVSLLILMNILLIKTLESQNKSLANNIVLQLNFAKSLGIPLNKISGVDTVLKKYIKENKSLAWINIKHNNHFIYDIPKPDLFAIEYKLKLNSNENETFYIHALTPIHLIFKKILINIKDFLFLLFASNIISYYLFITLNIFINNKQNSSPEDSTLVITKPLIFFLFLIDTFNIAILPIYFKELVNINNLDYSSIKYLFSAYFLFFVISFIPSAILIKKYGTKKIYLVAVVFSIIGTLLLLSSTDYYLIMIARIFSGMALGITLIATENHLNSAFGSTKRHFIPAITAMLYSLSIICGSIIGSLVSDYFGIEAIFLGEFILAIFILIYIIVYVEAQYTQKETPQTILPLSLKIRLLFKWEFIKSVFITGFFSKITLSGILFFALPLILSKQEFSKMQIGQIVVFYSIGIITTSYLISKYNIINQFKQPLFVGLFIGGVSMISIGLLEIFENIYFFTILLIVSVSILGSAHCIISSYLLPTIFNLSITKSMGINKVRPFVLLCERGGNIVGPLIMMELLILFNYSFTPILIFGAISILFAFSHILNIKNN